MLRTDLTCFTSSLLLFRSFSPTPRGLEFHPGQDYFFISTSTSTDLYLRAGGACRSHNMKVTFKVADNRAGPTAGVNSHQPAAVNSPRRSALLPSDDDDDDDDGDIDDDDDVGGDVISRSINSNNNNAYVRPIEDTRTFRSGLDQLYRGQERRTSAASHRREGEGLKHLPSTHSGGLVTRPPPPGSLLLPGLLLLAGMFRGRGL